MQKKSKNSQKLVEYRLILQLKPLGLNGTVGLNPKTLWRKETATLATIWSVTNFEHKKVNIILMKHKLMKLTIVVKKIIVVIMMVINNCGNSHHLKKEKINVINK